MKKQIYLEAIRGLAALLVVFAHYFAAFYPSTLFGNKYQAHERWESFFTSTPLGLAFASNFAICVFFVLSGYVLSLRYFGESSKDTNHLLGAIIKRPFRLAGLVIASELVSFCLLRESGFFNVAVSKASHSIPWFEGYWSQGAISFKRLFLDLTTNAFSEGSTYNPPLWTIQLELYGSYVTFIFLLLFRKSSLRLFAYLYALFYFYDQLYQGFIFGILLADISRNHFAAMTKCSKDFITYPLFAIGLLCASYPAYVDQSVLAETFYGALPRLRGLGGGYSMLGAVVVFASLLLSPREQRILTLPLFAFLGRISYALYAFHFLLLGSLSSWLFLHLQSKVSYNESFTIMFLVSLAVLILISHYGSKYIDQPITKGANRIAKLWLRSVGKTPTCQTNEPVVTGATL